MYPFVEDILGGRSTRLINGKEIRKQITWKSRKMENWRVCYGSGENP